ncbi:ESX-1 secretion-associated protein, partial [Mycolicibacterium setense]
MANLVVTPQYLQTLAATQTQAAATAASAGAASTNLKNEVWVSHGVISG